VPVPMPMLQQVAAIVMPMAMTMPAITPSLYFR